MTENWEMCVEQEVMYSAGWNDRKCGGPNRANDIQCVHPVHYRKGWHDADRRLKCDAIYAGYYARRESHEETAQ